MFRIDNSTAASALPAPGPAGTPGYFTEGDPAHGVAATGISGDWLNMIKEEFMSILAAADVGESKTTFNQVLVALRALFAIEVLYDVGQSTLALTFPGGLVIQLGGHSQETSSGSQNITLPVFLSAAPFWSTATNAAGGPPTAFHGTSNTSHNSITVYSSTSVGVPAPAGVGFFWAAAGFK